MHRVAEQCMFLVSIEQDLFSHSCESIVGCIFLQQQKKTIAPPSRWAAAETSSSDDEGRVVKSLKDRRWGAMREVIRQMENHMKILDFAELGKDYETLLKSYAKAHQVIEQEGVPNFFIRSLVELEAFIEEKLKDKESFKKLSRPKALALNTLRAKVRKTTEPWTASIAECKENPEKFETQSEESDEADSDSDFSEDESSEESEESEESSSDSEGDDKPKREKAEGASDDGSEWSDSEADEESQGEEGDRQKDAMAKWGVREEGERKRGKTSKKKSGTKGSKPAPKETSPGAAEAGFSTKDMEHLFDSTDINEEVIAKRVQMVVEKRGRRAPSQRMKIRALLHVAYSKSLHEDYYQARDLMHTPNVQELAMQTDISTQILYNRNLVQLGLCAFRNGLIQDAHACLSQICPKHKELLAQGLSNLKNVERTQEQERAEKRRLLPYHMHISMELIECVHNICAMLLEVPHMAHDAFDPRKRPISKHFRRMLEMYDRQTFVGPPENPRETVMAATKALQRGDWADCARHLWTLSIWEKMYNKERIQEMLLQKIKAEAMRTYIFTYLPLYDSFAIGQLASMFDLSLNAVHSIVSKMMINEEIHASWDETSQYILISRVKHTRLQQLALTLAENVANAVEQNELTLNMKNPKFALTHERRFLREGDRAGWGGREREDGNGHRTRPGFRGRTGLNPVGARGRTTGRGAYRGSGFRSNRSGGEYRGDYRDNRGDRNDYRNNAEQRDPFRIKFTSPLTYN
ncbi:Eukaryotic translation initiation factor 3 subunit C, related [Eimeria mitis]|uniref:Eukaryotic translation initiation factor 3 subunit C, related n=1 Tax=Eimeria mitis TaxID=44415 RepID=U6JQP8_9EIME|nr:Eukaryotic translation initiation factor 3 subunit C, related [Eimeria mitis]CDJ27815.1 Eukaryotic translation initiation factor 3 subunit C, related [Eimeria mitis]